MAQHRRHSGPVVSVETPTDIRIAVRCPIPAPTGECRECHLECCPVAVGVLGAACHSVVTQQTAGFCLGCFVYSCTAGDTPLRFLIARGECLVHLFRGDSAYLRAVDESKAMRNQLATCLSRLMADRKADRCSELLCEALALMVVCGGQIVRDRVWQMMPLEAVVLTLRKLFDIDQEATHSAVLTYLLRRDNALLIACVDTIARGESGELVTGAACEVVERVIGHILDGEDVGAAELWFLDSDLCRGLVARFSRGRMNDTAMRIMLMIAGYQGAVDALFMGSLDHESDIGPFHSFIHELEAAVEFHILQSSEEDVQEACIVLCRVFLVPAPPLVTSGPRTLSIVDWLLELVRTGSRMGSLAAVCLEDFIAACPEEIAKRVWNEDFVAMVLPSVGEEPIVALLATVLVAVKPHNIGEATLKALLRSVEVILCHGSEDHAVTVMEFLMGSVKHGDLEVLAPEVGSVLESVGAWASRTVSSDLLFGRICDLVTASSPEPPSVPLVVLMNQLSRVLLEHFPSSPVAMEAFLRATGALIGDLYESPRLEELQHRLRSAAVLVPALTAGSGPVVRLLLVGVVPRWLLAQLSVDELSGDAGELFVKGVELDGSSSVAALAVLFSSLTSDVSIGNGLLASAQPLTKLVVSEWEPRALMEALLLISHVLRLLSTRGCHRPLSQAKAQLLSAFRRAQFDAWKRDSESASHDTKHITQTLVWLLEDSEEVPAEILAMLAEVAASAGPNLGEGLADLVRAVVITASQQPQFCTPRVLRPTITLLGMIPSLNQDWEAEALLSPCCTFLARGPHEPEECALLCDLMTTVLMMHPVGVATLLDLGSCLEGLAAAQLTSSNCSHTLLRESCLRAASVLFELLRGHRRSLKCVWLGSWAESAAAEGGSGAVAFCGVAAIRLPIESLSRANLSIRCAYWSLALSTGTVKLNRDDIPGLVALGVEGVLMSESSSTDVIDSAMTMLSTLLVFARPARDCLGFSLVLACLPPQTFLTFDLLPYACLVLALVRFRPAWYRLDPESVQRHVSTVADALTELASPHRRKIGEALVKWASDLLVPRLIASINKILHFPAVNADALGRSERTWETWIVNSMIYRACDLTIDKLN